MLRRPGGPWRPLRGDRRLWKLGLNRAIVIAGEGLPHEVHSEGSSDDDDGTRNTGGLGI